VGHHRRSNVPFETLHNTHYFLSVVLAAYLHNFLGSAGEDSPHLNLVLVEVVQKVLSVVSTMLLLHLHTLDFFGQQFLPIFALL
jgi:hypothetical protein